MRKIFVFIVGLFIVGTVFAVGENVPTSKSYVDSAIAQKQDTIPANAGTAQVLTNTGVAGDVGTKNIYDSSAAYFNQTHSLVTADTMNAAVQNAIETEFKCISWVDNDPSKECLLLELRPAGVQTFIPDDGTATATLAMLMSLININGTGYCYKRLTGSYVYVDTACTTPSSNYGDWGAMFTYNNEPVQISGISACSTVGEGFISFYYDIPMNQSGVQADYAASGAGATLNTNPPGRFCYCKMTEPAESRWVFVKENSNSSDCATDCAYRCGANCWHRAGMRSALFNSVQ